MTSRRAGRKKMSRLRVEIFRIYWELGIETEKVRLSHDSKALASTVVLKQVKMKIKGSEARLPGVKS